MRTKQIEIYKYNELSEKAKERVKNTMHFDVWDFWGTDIRDALDTFCNILDLNFKGLSYNIHAFSFKYDQNDYIKELKGVRALKWLENNLLRKIRKGKYLKYVGDIPRYSKCQFTVNDCNLTGYCYDNILIYPIWDKEQQKEIVTFNLTIEDILEKCAASIQEAIDAEQEYMESDVYIAGHCEEHDCEFYANGERY